jgi:hypothetical protein
VGAILDDGNRTGVWVVNGTTSTVKFTPVKVQLQRGNQGETRIASPKSVPGE